MLKKLLPFLSQPSQKQQNQSNDVAPFNLLSSDAESVRHFALLEKSVFVSDIVLLVVSCACLFFLFQNYLLTKKLEQKSSDLQKVYFQIKNDAGLAPIAQTIKINQKISLYNTFKDQRVLLAPLSEKISSVITKTTDTHVAYFTISQKGVTFQVSAKTPYSIAQLISQLLTQGDLSHISITSAMFDTYSQEYQVSLEGVFKR